MSLFASRLFPKLRILKILKNMVNLDLWSVLKTQLPRPCSMSWLGWGEKKKMYGQYVTRMIIILDFIFALKVQIHYTVSPPNSRYLGPRIWSRIWKYVPSRVPLYIVKGANGAKLYPKVPFFQIVSISIYSTQPNIVWFSKF